jgi:hypothetical protein
MIARPGMDVSPDLPYDIRKGAPVFVAARRYLRISASRGH